MTVAGESSAKVDLQEEYMKIMLWKVSKPTLNG